jgi:putative phage-type endonuclease
LSNAHIEQGSPEWIALRIGKATASRIADICRRTQKGGLAASHERYLVEVLTERLTGRPHMVPVSADMEWGTRTEPMAAAAFALQARGRVEKVAFVDHPTIPMAGASPDRLVGDDGLAEIKCPRTETHVALMISGRIDPDYVVQMQWQMACTGRAWCDFVSFDPRLPEAMRLVVIRVPRDEKRIAAIEDDVRLFLDDVARKVEGLGRLYAPEPLAA